MRLIYVLLMLCVVFWGTVYFKDSTKFGGSHDFDRIHKDDEIDGIDTLCIDCGDLQGLKAPCTA